MDGFHAVQLITTSFNADSNAPTKAMFAAKAGKILRHDNDADLAPIIDWLGRRPKKPLTGDRRQAPAQEEAGQKLGQDRRERRRLGGAV